jgi:hypothetical protein
MLYWCPCPYRPPIVDVVQPGTVGQPLGRMGTALWQWPGWSRPQRLRQNSQLMQDFAAVAVAVDGAAGMVEGAAGGVETAMNDVEEPDANEKIAVGDEFGARIGT